MHVRWMAVLTGFIVDTVISFFLSSALSARVTPAFSTAPDMMQPADLILVCLLVLSTGIGGYVAGRMAPTNRALHGLLVGVLGILVSQLDLLVAGGPGVPRVFIIASGAGCLIGALGGFLSRYPSQQ